MVHFGLIGARLGHSLSPQIHQLIFKELGVEGTYDLLEIPPEELYASVHELRGKYCRSQCNHSAQDQCNGCFDYFKYGSAGYWSR